MENFMAYTNHLREKQLKKIAGYYLENVKALDVAMKIRIMVWGIRTKESKKIGAGID